MALATGTRLGPYEVVAPIGVGGMGEVYRARDTKLDREVAIKTLPEEFASDDERSARFEREARILGSLSHPHIAVLHGLEEFDGMPFLVMELVEGDTLAARLAQGAMTPDAAIPLFARIADALELAHEKGIVHRDLKPSNVVITTAGMPKILDFGIAKAISSGPPDGDGSESSTVTRHTDEGVILGTTPYMSPEQTKGATVDRRTDIWAFGCCLYEALTGRAPFLRPSAAETVNAILGHDPDWTALPSATPSRLRELLSRCFAKDPRRRMQHMGDARIELELAQEEREVSPVPTAAKPFLRWFVIVVALAGLTAGVVVLSGRHTPAGVPAHLAVDLGQEVIGSRGTPVSIAADGERFVFHGSGGLAVRELSSRTSKQLNGTRNGYDPFLSPKGKWVGYFSHGDYKLKKLALSGGLPVPLCDIPRGSPLGRGASWGSSGIIVFAASEASVLKTIPETGGTPEALTALELGEVAHRWPEFLPDGESVLFSIVYEEGDTDIAIVSLVTRERHVIVKGGTAPRFAESGHLVFGQDGGLHAAPFDSDSAALMGAPVPVFEPNVVNTGLNDSYHFAISRTGTLAYVPTDLQDRLVAVSRDGARRQLNAEPAIFEDAAASPDGNNVAVTADGDIWVQDLTRDTFTRLTFEGRNHGAVWTPDTRFVSYVAEFDNGVRRIERHVIDGSSPPETLLESTERMYPNSWSPDGSTLLYFREHPDTFFDLWLWSSDAPSTTTPFLATPYHVGSGRFSPDGRWIAYGSKESGRWEVYVQPYGGEGRDDTRKQISIDGGIQPVWSADGRELFFARSGAILAVDVEAADGELRIGTPQILFEGSFRVGTQSHVGYDVTPQGRFILAERLPQKRIELVVHWFQELERLVPTQ